MKNEELVINIEKEYNVSITDTQNATEYTKQFNFIAEDNKIEADFSKSYIDFFILICHELGHKKDYEENYNENIEQWSAVIQKYPDGCYVYFEEVCRGEEKAWEYAAKIVRHIDDKFNYWDKFYKIKHEKISTYNNGLLVQHSHSGECRII